MLVDENGVFLTQRSDPRMTRFRVAFAENGLLISGPSAQTLQVPFLLAEDEAKKLPRVEVKVWDSVCESIEYDDSVSDWFSKHLDRRARLVWMPEDFYRPTDPSSSIEGDHVGFADAMPVLVTSTASLNDLNQRLEVPIPMNRFRANIVLAGAKPYQEDSLSGFTLGGVRFRASKRCGRCRVPCTDQTTGEISDEPLRTLASYRREGNTVFFGQYFIPETKGSLAVGETVEAPEFT